MITKVIAVILFGLAVYFFIYMLMILLAICNMDKVLRLTRLNQESYEDIINHYDEYVKAYPIKEFKYSPEDE